ncbi:MAG: histidine kinase dimerization/phospho-acceptor domain-containing protein, partial [Verrucomicrobiota bacterium]
MERAIPKPPAVEAALAEKRDLLARLLGRLAHEIRNPLSSVDIHFQLLEEDLLGVEPDLLQKLSPRLELIQGELHRLKTIVERFLRLASPSAIDPELTHLEKVVGRVCE